MNRRGIFRIHGLKLCSSAIVAIVAAVLPLSATLAQTRPSLACLDLPTVEVLVPAIAMGSYVSNGGHNTTPIVGRFLFGGAVLGPFRNYFVYDLRAIQQGRPLLNAEDLVVAGELVTYNKGLRTDGIDGFRSDSSDTLTFTLNRVAWTDNLAIANLMGHSAGPTGYVDLADGPVYGNYVASAANNGIQFNIRFSDMAVRDINRTNSGLMDGLGRLLFAIGGTLTNLADTADNAILFGGGVPYASLLLKMKRYQGTGCPMPRNTQYQ